jgi:pyridoxamine 5'-phosphate oxidase family protein
MFTEIEYRDLSSHRYGRSASIGPDGAPQIHPVVFVIVTDRIDIDGPRLATTRARRAVTSR